MTLATYRLRRQRKGNAIVEFALVAPLLFGLMLAVFDSGIYVYSFISVQSAARSAAMRNSGSTETAADQATACSIATNQLQGLPSIASAPGSCSAAPLVVTSVLCGRSSCGSAGASADGTYSTLVTVRYSVPFVFGIPLAGPPTIAAVSQMKLRSVE
jgi:Flp pilus assembly protein TadG